MANTFPLYDTFYKSTKQLEHIPLTELQLDDFLRNIQLVTNHEIFYMLIRVFSIEHNLKDQIPYNGKQLNKGIRFDLKQCPTHLQQILYTFITKHLNTEQKSTF